MFLESKAAYAARLFEILNPLLPHYSPSGARLKIGYTGDQVHLYGRLRHLSFWL